MADSILVVEDDPKIREVVAFHLEEFNCKVDCADDGQVGLDMALANDYALAVLDLVLPNVNGLEICRQLRQKKSDMLILMLTSKAEEVDKVVGLELGADDYLTKPFSVRELSARVKALLRRRGEKTKQAESAGSGATSDKIVLGKLAIDQRMHQVSYDGNPLNITLVEYHILSLLASQPGKVFSKEAIIHSLDTKEVSIYETTLATHICRLRAKIEVDPSGITMIHTVRGVGYRFADPSELSVPN